MSAPPTHDAAGLREAALARVLERREAGRAGPVPVRVLRAAAGAVLGLVSLPLAVLLPELGIPALLLALRLLAVELLWAARAYAWITWRWAQLLAWFRSRSAPVRGAIVLALLLVAVLLVWLLLHGLG